MKIFQFVLCRHQSCLILILSSICSIIERNGRYNMEMDESCLHIMSSKKVIILSTALAPVRSKKSKKCNYSSSFMVNAASSPNHSFAMTFHPFTILRLLERKEKIFHELEKMAERLFAEIDQQTWFSRMLC